MTAVEAVYFVGAILLAFTVGSFTNVIIDRLPVLLDEPNEFGELWGTRPWGEVLGGRSRCSSCGEPVRAVDNIPVISWLVLRGKCRSCGEKIPAFHLIVELAVPVLVVAAILYIDWHPQLAGALWLIPAGVAISVIDLRTLIVPTKLVWPAFAGTLIVTSAVALIEGHPDWLWGGVIGVGVLSGPLFLIWLIHPRGMGFGDVRLTVMLGWHVGFAATLAGGSIRTALFLGIVCMAISAVVGLLYSVFTIGVGRQVPFGPALVAGALICVAIAEPMITSFQT